MFIEFRTGDVLKLKKARPCSSYEWNVVRLGADIALKYHRYALIGRIDLERWLKEFVSRGV